MSDLFNFKDWLDNLDKLTDDQKEELFKRLSDQGYEKNRNLKEQGLVVGNKGKVIGCPHCGSATVVKHGSKDGKQRYRCKDCKKTFIETTDTFFHRSRLEVWQWKELLRGMVENLSIPKIAANTGLGETAVWRNRNKVLQMVSDLYGEQDRFKDIAECDETFVHLSYKGKRDPRFFIYLLKRMPRHHRNYAEKVEYLQKYNLWNELQDDPEFLEQLLMGSKRSETSLPGTNEDSVCVLTGIDRSDNTYIKPVCLGSMETTHVTTNFDERFAKDAILVTDGNSTYNWFAEERMIHHEVIPADRHAVGPYSLSRVNALHASYKANYSKNKGNLPATKYLELGSDFFWWLEKRKGKPAQELVDELFQMILDNKLDMTYEEIVHRKLNLDTKGLIPTEL